MLLMQFHEEFLCTYRKNNYISKKSVIPFVFAVCAFVFCSFSAGAEIYEFGGKTGWSEVNVRNGITTGKGRFGFECLELETNSSQPDDFTDCLLDFENSKIYDKAGKYKIKSSGVYFSKKTALGKTSVLSRAAAESTFRVMKQAFLARKVLPVHLSLISGFALQL